MLKTLININGKLIDLATPKIMAIVNATPDSFYPESRLADNSPAERAKKFILEGADIIDIGACSTRPGSTPPSEDEEWSRLQPILKSIRQTLPDAIISVDTFRSNIAKHAVEDYGVNIINDISGGMADTNMFDTICNLQVTYILTHNSPDHKNSIAEIIDYLQSRIYLLQNKGLKDIIIDPGLGFNKTLEQNWHILSHLSELKIFELPILIGLSRKSMLTKTLSISAEEALNATTAAHMAALLGGANILRVHDVKETKQTIILYNNYNKYI